MKLSIVLVLFNLNLIQIINSKKVRCNFYDEIYSYGSDNSVIPHEEFFSCENLTYEQIDDDTVLVDGHLEFIRSMNSKLPMMMDLRTEYYEHGMWKEGAIRLTEKDMCTEFLNPSRFWYNVTKLWTNCPVQEGFKWEVERQNLDLLIDLPANFPTTLWKWYILVLQGPAGLQNEKYGFSLQLEFVPV